MDLLKPTVTQATWQNDQNWHGDVSGGSHKDVISIILILVLIFGVLGAGFAYLHLLKKRKQREERIRNVSNNLIDLPEVESVGTIGMPPGYNQSIPRAHQVNRVRELQDQAANK